MKHTSQLQQLHLLLASEQPGPTDSNGYGVRETNKTSTSLDLDDSSSSGVSCERDISNSGTQPSRSHSDSATSRDLSPDHNDAYPCSSSGCSVRSGTFSVSSSSPCHPTSLRTSCILTCTSTRPSNTHGDSLAPNKVANFVADNFSNLMTAVNKNGSVKNEKNNKSEQDHENTMRNCLRDESLSVTKHDPGADWAMRNFLSDICRDINTDDPLKSHIGDLHDYSFETLETSDRPDISDTQSVLSMNRHQKQIEIEQVHQVYKQIAPHCDHVRQKAWPRVKQFLKDLEPGSLVADVGCGNGRYLMINPSIFKVGCDLCPPFLDQARGQGHEVMISDNLALPFRDGTFDAVISIGVIHHFASLERRIMAISELSRILSPGGRLMVYVWAFEQVHRKFEGQDILIPWVKPAVKGYAPRKSLSLSSESDNETRGSRSNSCGVDNTDGRQRPECRLGSDGEKHRSKSLGDESSERDVSMDFSIASGHCGSQTLGKFDQRVCKKRETANQGSGQLENTASIDKSKHECARGKENEDFIKVSKWPGQLVSECKKLGKFLRSLSSRSISLGVEEADQQDFKEDTPDVYRNCQFYCNTNLRYDMNTTSTPDMLDGSIYGPLPDANYDTNDCSKVIVQQFDQYKNTQDSNNSLCGPNLRMTTSCAAKCSDGNINPVASCDSYQVYHNAAAITTSSDAAIVNHNILASFSGSKCTADSDAKVYQQTLSTSDSSKCTADSDAKVYQQTLSTSDSSKCTADSDAKVYQQTLSTSDSSKCTADSDKVYQQTLSTSDSSKCTANSDTKVYQQTLSTSDSSKCTADSGFKGSYQALYISDGSKFTLDTEPMSKDIHIQNPKSSSSQETLCHLYHKDKHLEGIDNEHVVAQSTYIIDNCLGDIFNNHTQSVYDTDVEARSESWTTVSSTESNNSEDTVSSHSDTTLLESHFSSKTNILAQGSENPEENPPTHEASIRCGDAPKTPLDSLIETTACVSMGIIHESVNVQGLNKCLPKCQNKCHNTESESSYHDPKQLDEKTSNPDASRCDTISVVAEGLSETSSFTDHFHSSSALSLDRGKLVDSTTSNIKYNVLEAMSESHMTKYNSSTLDNRCIDKDGVEVNVDKIKKYVFEPDKMMLQATQGMAVNGEEQKWPHSSLSQEVVPYRGTLKTFLNKLANYFRPHSQTGSNKFGCYHNGNSSARKFLFESESSDIESPVSSFSTHSSCYPGLFSMSKERDNCEKVDCISETVPHKYETGIYDDDFDIINKVHEPVDDNRANTNAETEKLKLSISVLNSKQNCRQDFVNDVSMTVVEPTKDAAKNLNEDPYVFKVENISQVPVKKASFINNMSQKWSGLFGKPSRADSKKPRLNYSTTSVSSSSDGNEERLKISLTDSEINVSKVPPQKRPLVRRPNSLDFNKKRTRRSGRRPAPRKENTQGSIDLDRIRRIQEKVPLSLSDAMTLLGDGVDEENIIKRLDIPAKTIFAEMKRINFAMRKFPMSSLGNSSSKEDITKEAESTENVHYDVTNPRQALKMRRDKKLLTTNRGFSESVAAQDITKNRRQLFQANKEVDEIDLTNIPCLDKKCISEDFGISLDMLGGHIHKSKCRLLYACNSDSTLDLSALLESSPEMQQDPRNFQNPTSNAQVSLDDTIRSHTFGNIQQGQISTTHHTNKIKHGNTVDRENKKVAGMDLTRIHGMDRKCISEDFGISFDKHRGQIHKSKCQLLYSCSDESQQDLSALLESSSEIHEDPRHFQNQTNNPQVSPEETKRSDSFGYIKQGNISTSDHDKKFLHGNTVDTENQKVAGMDLTRIHSMDRKCTSEDFGISFDKHRGQINKSKCQLLYSCSDESQQDLSALLESSSEIHEDPRHFQNRTNNAQVSTEETIRSHTFGKILQGNILTTHRATKILHGNTVDTENKKVAGMDLTRIHGMDRKCISEDFGISFDKHRGQIHKSKCQLLYSCSDESQQDLSALLESSSEIQEGLKNVQNQTNGAQVSPEETHKSDSVGNIKQGNISTSHHAKTILHRNTVDKETKKVPGIDLTHIHCMDRKCISEDFGISFDMLRGQIHKSKCQLLYSCSSESKQDIPALHESSSELQDDQRHFQNRTNNTHISLKDRLRSDTFGEIQNWAALTTHHTQKLLNRKTADTECKSLSKYVTRNNSHSAESLVIQSDDATTQKCSQEGHNFAEVSEVTIVKDGYVNMGNDVKLTYPSSLSGNNMPLKTTNHNLQPRQTMRSNKHRPLDNQQTTDSKVDNSLSRYYHVFKKGELDQLVTRHVPSLRIVDTFYDHANWCVIAEKLTVP